MLDITKLRDRNYINLLVSSTYCNISRNFNDQFMLLYKQFSKTIVVLLPN